MGRGTNLELVRALGADRSIRLGWPSMNALLVIALALVALWAILTIAFEAAGLIINLLLLASILILAWWAIRRVRS